MNKEFIEYIKTGKTELEDRFHSDFAGSMPMYIAIRVVRHINKTKAKTPTPEFLQEKVEDFKAIFRANGHELADISFSELETIIKAMYQAFFKVYSAKDKADIQKEKQKILKAAETLISSDAYGDKIKYTIQKDFRDLIDLI